MKRLLLVSKIMCIAIFAFALFLIAGNANNVHAELSALITSPPYYGWQNYSWGYRFTPTVTGTVTQLKCYNVSSQSGLSSNTVTLWSDSGTNLAQASVPCSAGWGSYTLPTPVPVTAGTYYRVSVSPGNYYQALSSVPVTNGNITIDSGWYTTAGQNVFPGPSVGGYVVNSGTGIYGVPDVTVTAGGGGGGTLDNGAGGSYSCSGCTNAQHALAACESKNGVGTCSVGACGNFSYYYKTSEGTCNCAKAINSYEWIYNNSGAGQVGQDYGGQTTSVSGDSLFVRKKGSSTCDANSWILALKDLGTATAGAGGGGGTPTTFSYTGAQQTWVVPAGVSSVTIEAWGAAGGRGYGNAGTYTGQTGGLGGYAKGTLNVTAGQTLYVYVGGAGQNGAANVYATGGFGGGGNASPAGVNSWVANYSGGGGGGASDVRYGGNALSNRVVVGGGGGGGGSYTNATGGGGGYSSGVSAPDPGAGPGGTGGTQSAGGTAGFGTPGSLGQGGIGAYCAGGGGGGYYGGGPGGGSCNSSGAGGGSSYTAAGVTSTLFTNSTRSGNGQVIITPGGGGGGATAATSGPNNPTSATNSVAIGNTAWVNPSYALTTNSSYAYTTVSPGNTSYYLFLYGYNFAIPSTATITGIEVVPRGYWVQTSGSSSAFSMYFKLLKNGAVIGTAKAGSLPSGAPGTVTLGGSNDLWGTTWTPSEINAANFGIGAWLEVLGGIYNGTIQELIDSVTFKIYYTTTSSTSTLTVNYTGSGVITDGVTPHIYCPSTCSYAYPSGTSVTLYTTPTAGYNFSSWSGGPCNGLTTSTCTFTISSAQSVTANFTVASYTLTANKSGLGTGTITSNPAYFNCGTTCSNTYPYGTSVTLYAAPSAGSTFGGWSGGGCSGTVTQCTVSMTAAQTVTATFNTNYTLSVSKTGAGGGSITSNPAGISCGATCSYSFGSGTSVVLTATPDSTSAFTGWTGGGCSGTGTCTVPMSAATSVSAAFLPVTAASIINPVDNTPVGSSAVVFTRNASDPVATAYSLSLGHTFRGTDIVNKVAFPLTTLSYNVGTLDNRTIYATLWSTIGGVDYPRDYTYTASLSSYNGSDLDTKKLYYSTGPIPITNGLIMKIVPIYNSTPVGIVFTPDPGVTVPPQGKVITSTGSSGETKRKIIYFESYPQIPSEIFSYGILSQ